MDIYKNNFVFVASSIEEIIVGGNRYKGQTRTTIKGDILSNEAIHFTIIGQVPKDIAPVFVLPILGSLQGGDVLPDRVMYGRLPQVQNGGNPMHPVVCEIFNNMTTIRFAMQHPLRIIEFYGQFIV